MISGLLPGAPANGVPPGPEARELPLIIGFRNIWNLDGAARELRYRVQIDALVNYYDPLWSQLWCQEDDATFFVAPPANRPFPIRAGQLVRLTGEMRPADGFAIDRFQATVLKDNAAPPPLVAAGRLAERNALNERTVVVEGYVDWQEDADPNHERFSLISEGRLINGTILLPRNSPLPQLEGSLVRVQGVYIGRLDPENRLQRIDLNVPDPSQVVVLGWIANDPRFELALSRIADLPNASTGRLVHVAGQVSSFDTGRSVTIRDDTGQLDLLTSQTRLVQIGEQIEAIGLPAIEGTSWYLDQALWRSRRASAAPAAVSRNAPLLRLAAQVMELTPEQAAARQPVQLSGVVTWSAPGAPFFYLQDPSGGVRVSWDETETPNSFLPGAGVTVKGATIMGPFAPGVAVEQIRAGASMSPPTPQRFSLEQAETGAGEARWVEMDGYLRGLGPDGSWTRLDIMTATGSFQAFLPATNQLASRVGAFIRVRGVCSALANDARQLTGVQLWVPQADQVDLVETSPADLFALPSSQLGGLGRFGAQPNSSRWFHTSGIVTYNASGRYLLIQDQAEALTVLTRGQSGFEPGDRIEVVGIPGREATRMVLREAVARKTGSAREPEPVLLVAPFPLADTLDSRLARLTGILTETADLGREYYLTVRSGPDSIIARLSWNSRTPLPAAWQKGSKVTATGIYRLRFDEYRTRTGFELHLRRPSDLVVIQLPPWWTTGRALAAAGILAACVGLVTLWVFALRRRVQRQTVQIRRQIERQASLEAELERAQRLHSLGWLAGGIAHDFNNLLTAIMGNLSLALLDDQAMARVGEFLQAAVTSSKRARDLTQQLITFARGGDPLLESLDLPTASRAAAELALSGAQTRAEFRFSPGLWPVHADRDQLGRALHNLFVYARTAMPDGGVVSVEAGNETVGEQATRPVAPGRYVRLTFADHGPGIPPDKLTGFFDPYAASKFGDDRLGLAITYSIIKKHAGHIEVQSEAGCGTTFHLWLPAADTPPVAPPVPLARPRGLAGARILLMDDEEAIRNLTQRLLARLNCPAQVAADGEECVRLYRKAMEAGTPFDLVILDLTVPGGMGGTQTLTALRALDPNVRAIVSSGYSVDPVLANFRAHGFKAVVPKPYEVTVLTETITRVLSAASEIAPGGVGATPQ